MSHKYIVESGWEPTRYQLGDINLATFREPQVNELFTPIENTEYARMKARHCDIEPPREILDVLHEAEAAGVKIPDVVGAWWMLQTDIDMSRRETNKAKTGSTSMPPGLQ